METSEEKGGGSGALFMARSSNCIHSFLFAFLFQCRGMQYFELLRIVNGVKLHCTATCLTINIKIRSIHFKDIFKTKSAN